MLHDTDHVFDAAGTAGDGIEECFHGVTGRNHRTERMRPARFEQGEIGDRVREGLRSGVDDPEDRLIFQDEVFDDVFGSERFECLVTGNPGEDIDSVGSKQAQDVEGELCGSEGFIHEIDAADVFHHLVDGGGLRGDITGADFGSDNGAGIRGGEKRVDKDLISGGDQFHCAEQPDGAGAEYQRSYGGAAPRASEIGRAPLRDTPFSAMVSGSISTAMSRSALERRAGSAGPQ